MTEGPAAPSNGIRRRRRLLRSGTPEERHRIAHVLFPRRGRAWWFRFALMMGLSLTIAVMGLSADSSAVVIGAMLIAPLMTPVVAVAASLAMALPRHLARSGTAVLLATVGGVALAWGLARLLPVSDRALTHEVLSRTSPDLRDLMVALAAGAAGAYATAREDVSAALPGVAVAVALVPPIATFGFTLAAGRSDLAKGALLLYGANLVAIVLASLVVLLLSGFVPARYLLHRSPTVLAGFAAAAAATVLVAIPLGAQSARAVRQVHRTQAVNASVVAWLGPNSGLQVLDARVHGHVVTVDVAGPSAPPQSDSLRQALTRELGTDAAVSVRWFQEGMASGAVSNGSASSPDAAELRSLVEAWLAQSPEGRGAFDLVDITTPKGEVIVDLAGAAAPPPVGSLAKAIEAHLGRREVVRVQWTERHEFSSSPTTSEGALPPAVHAVADAWTGSRGLDVVGVLVDATSVTVDIAGPAPPPEVASLTAQLMKVAGVTRKVVIRFTVRQLLVSTSGGGG